jgi:hypothetical protein
MRRVRIILFVVFAAILLAACGEQTAVETAQPATTPVPDAPAYPAPAYPEPAYPAPAYPEPAYPAPVPDQPDISTEPLVVPEPSSDQVGNVTGTLFELGDANQQAPLAGYTVFLGQVLRDASGQELLVELDKLTAPQAVTNGLGQFAFVDVAPGRYGLFLDTVRGVVLLKQPDSGADMIIDLSGGQTFDMGDMAYPLP